MNTVTIPGPVFIQLTRSAAPDDAPDRADEDVQAERALLARIGAGDADALRSAYEQHGGIVYAVAMRYLGDHQLAEECTQDVFLTLWRKARSVNPARARLGTWLFTVTRNRAISLDRSRRTRPSVPVAEPPITETTPGPDAVLERTHRSEAMAEALAELAPEQRQTIALAFLEGLTHHEIAARLDLPLGTVKGRARLALDRLRRRLDPATFTDGESP